MEHFEKALASLQLSTRLKELEASEQVVCCTYNVSSYDGYTYYGLGAGRMHPGRHQRRRRIARGRAQARAAGHRLVRPGRALTLTLRLPLTLTPTLTPNQVRPGGTYPAGRPVRPTQERRR